MSIDDALFVAETVFLGYFIGINAIYLILNGLSFLTIKPYLDSRSMANIPRPYTAFEPPVTVIMPAYNEELTIITGVRSMLQLQYAEFEVVVVNDGSKDRTLEMLKDAFDLREVPFDYWEQIPAAPARRFYLSATYPNLLVVDKENGGKADAINAGINAARYPLFCCVDADSVLERNSLTRVVNPFLDDPRTVASGGTVTIVNGCVVRDGFIEKVDLPSRMLPLVQLVEYLRAFLFGRLGWNAINAVLIISGAFGVFRKESVIAVGGYRQDTIGEDMELVCRLHCWHRMHQRPYRVTFIPDPICWTEAPESLRVLKSQRVRWQRGLGQSLLLNRALLFDRRGGPPGWIGFPVMALFEWLGPAIEVAGYVVTIAAFAFGLISFTALAAFMLLALSLGILLSLNALLLEVMTFQAYEQPRQLLRLLLAVMLENLGYRQLNAIWRVRGLVEWASGASSVWGDMKRSARWQRED